MRRRVEAWVEAQFEARVVVRFDARVPEARVV